MIGFGNLDKFKKKKIKRANPSTIQKINRAIKFHSEGNISEAVKLYQKLISQGFADQRVFSNYGGILNDFGKFEDAELAYRKAIELNPDYEIAHSNLGNILRNLGKFEDAELAYRKAIELNPDYEIAHYNLGNIFRNQGRLEDAELAYRKAIELNPDYANAHSNLGKTLRDLGKLEELLVFSKLTIESRPINQGYKLVAALNITIGNLLKGDFPELLFSLNKTNELINKGALNIIKNNKNKKHSLTYSKFINALYPLLNKEIQSLKKIPHIGESHCLSFAHQTISLSSEIKVIQPVLITGAKAWHFANNKNNQWKSSFNKQIKNHNYSDEVFISFGEIDCRKVEGILFYAIKQNKNISEVCKKTIKGYLDYMEKILSSNYLRRYYFGIAAPTRSEKLLDELDKKRVEIIKKYNIFLKKEVLSRNAYFVDVYGLTSNKDGENNNLYMCDKTHLSPKCLSNLFKNYLYKPDNIIELL